MKHTDDLRSWNCKVRMSENVEVPPDTWDRFSITHPRFSRAWKVLFSSLIADPNPSCVSPPSVVAAVS